MFSDNVLYYAILVAAMTAIDVPSTGSWNGESWPDLRRGENAECGNGTVLTYQTTPVKWEPFCNSSVVSYTIGTGECDAYNYCNIPLKENYKYALKVRAFTRSSYKDTEVVYFETLERLSIKFVTMVLGGILITGVLAVILSIIKFDGLFIPYFFNPTRVTPTSSIFFKSYPPNKFRQHAYELLQTTGRLNNEFHLLGTLTSNLTTLCLHGRRIDNRDKNRYGDILPYDVTRVELSLINGDPSTDYINANFIKGYHQNVGYIAAQGPKKETCHDFYRMIIEHNIELIIMLTDLSENGVELCYKYFPDVNAHLTFNDIEVCCVSENYEEFWIERKLTARSPYGEINITQLHFENWPDFGCPENTEDVLRLLGKSCNVQKWFDRSEYASRIPRSGLMLVHGTAGTGRSGTFIAIDIMRHCLKHSDKMSVFNTVLDLRRQRVNMVQTVSQYAFIYKCIIHIIDASSKNKV